VSDGSDDRIRDEELEGQEAELLPNREAMSIIRDPAAVTPFPGDMPVDPPAEPPAEGGPVPE
jgi:hypothetical protein